MNIVTLSNKLLTNAAVRELNMLLKELRGDSFHVPSFARWRVILAQKDVRFFVVFDEKKIVGMAMLRWHELTGGRTGTVEDVVVIEDHRGKGLGGLLMKELIQWAGHHRCIHLDLTSRPEKVAANHLYEKLGFKKRDTNVYRFIFKQL